MLCYDLKFQIKFWVPYTTYKTYLVFNWKPFNNTIKRLKNYLLSYYLEMEFFIWILEECLARNKNFFKRFL